MRRHALPSKAATNCWPLNHAHVMEANKEVFATVRIAMPT